MVALIQSLRIGGLEIALDSDRPVLPPRSAAYASFVSSAPASIGSGPGRFRLRIEAAAVPGERGGVILESDAPWRVLADGPLRRIAIARVAGPPSVLALQPGSPDLLFQYPPDLAPAQGRAGIRCPFQYPVDQIALMYLLGCRGLLVHAAGMRLEGGGVVLFAGVSGAGKSTFASLAAGRPGWEPLSDDRMLVRVEDDEGSATAHGTPWPGTGHVAANAHGPLQAVFFLAQSQTNGVRALSPGQAARRLLATTSIPWFDEEHVGAALEAVERLARRVRAALLTFRPETAAVDLVEQALSRSGTRPVSA